MSRRTLIPTSLSLVSVLIACGGGGSDARVSELTKRVDSLRSEVAADRLERAVEKLEQATEGVAYLTPGSTDYALVRSDLGVLTVALVNIQPYANGSRVSLRIGNLTSATINGAKFSIDWGQTDSSGSPKPDEKTRDVTLTDPLRDGAWTNASVVLEGIPPNQLGFVRIRNVKHTGIGLRR